MVREGWKAVALCLSCDFVCEENGEKLWCSCVLHFMKTLVKQAFQVEKHVQEMYCRVLAHSYMCE